MANTATVAAGNGEVDVNTSNNAASATDGVGIFAGDFEGPFGAGRGTRTPDLLITNQLLYQLSYAGN